MTLGEAVIAFDSGGKEGGTKDEARYLVGQGERRVADPPHETDDSVKPIRPQRPRNETVGAARVLSVIEKGFAGHGKAYGECESDHGA